MKLAILLVTLLGVWAEPPSSYLPPQARNSLSGSYGPPSQGGSYSYNSLADNQFSRQKDSYSSRQFGAQSRQQPQFGAAAPRQQSQFGAAAPRQQSQFGAAAPRQQPQFGAAAPRQQPQFGVAPYQQPQFGAAPRQQYGPPSSEYGAPFGRSKMDDDLAEPANYEYNYEVQAAEESGPEFGHQETREDDFARGEYHVLLPDGRMQIVEYEADEEGFRPKIRYEETGYPDARDNQGPY